MPTRSRIRSARFRPARLLPVVSAVALLLAGCVGGSPAAVAPSASVSAVPGPASGAVPATPLASAQPLVGVKDSTGHLTIAVPAGWLADTTPFTGGSDEQWSSIVAAPDLNRFPADITATGVEFSMTAVGSTPSDQVLRSILDTVSTSLAAGCTTAGTAQPYDTSAFHGLLSTYTACGGTDTIAYVLALTDHRTGLGYVIGHIPSAQAATGDAIVASITAAF